VLKTTQQKQLTDEGKHKHNCRPICCQYTTVTYRTELKQIWNLHGMSY